MTTIAYKDGVLAWDSQITGDAKYVGIKGLKDEDRGVIIAGCGNIHAMFSLMDWYLDDTNEVELPRIGIRDDVELVAVWRDGTVESINRKGWIAPIDRGQIYATGSGQQAAIAGMTMGLDAKGAVELAAKVDDGTSAPVHAESW